MGQPQFPTLEESTQAVAQHLAGLQRTLVYPAGVAVQHFPDSFSDAFGPAASAVYAFPEVYADGVKHLAGQLESLPEIPDTINNLAGVLAGVTSALDFQPIIDVLHESLARNVELLRPPLDCICESVQPMHVDLVGLAGDVRDLSDGVQGMLYRLIHEIKDKIVDVDVTAEFDLAGAVDKLGELLREIAPELLPPAPVANNDKPGSFFGQNVQATISAVKNVLGGAVGQGMNFGNIAGLALKAADDTADNLVPGYVDAVANLAGKMSPTGNPSIGGYFGKLLGRAEGLWESLTAGGVATPATAWKRGLTAYAGAAGLGLAASFIAGLAEADVLGCGDLNFGYVTSILTRLSGFDPIVKAFSGPLYWAYLNRPFQYETNRLARPLLPGTNDVQRMRYKRIFERSPHDPCTVTPPHTFQECMAYLGYSDEWIAIWEDDLYREPSMRDLLMMAEATVATDEWWEYKIRRLGYSDDDAPIMVQGAKRRASRTQIMDLYRRHYNLAAEGFITLDDFKERASETKLPEMAIEYGAKAATVELELEQKRDQLAWARKTFQAGGLDDDEMQDYLEQIYPDPEQAGRVFRIELAKKYRKVYYLRPDEEARAALPLMRRAFLAGAITEYEYRTHLQETGLEGRNLDITMTLDLAKRDDAMLARFRRFGLPALRDQVMHGLESVDHYLAELVENGFPRDYVAPERAYVTAQVERRKAQAVRSGQLPAYRTAYVLGLIPGATLARAMADAGLPEAAIDAERTVLDFRRAETERRRKETAERDEARRLAKERADAERARKEREREIEAYRREQERAVKALEKQAAAEAKRLAAEAKAAAKARRPDWPGDVARIQKQIAGAYKKAGQLLPDDVWQLGLDLTDELARIPGPDEVKVDELIGRIEMALARHAGVLPE